MKDTTFQKNQTERQARKIEEHCPVFYGARNRGLASWSEKGEIKQRPSRKVLQSIDREKNLYQPIREEVMNYTKRNHIKWWHMEGESDDTITAHILSSQVHCFNHLFAVRNDPEAIQKILEQATGITFDEILPSLIDNEGYISFEFVYKNKDLLHEKYETRGAKCTSIDALIYARKGEEKWLIPIEWKYTEAYDKKSKMFTNYERYCDMPSPTSRLARRNELYRKDPFYELGRQTLLMEKIIENEPLTASQFFHIVVVPQANNEMWRDAQEFRNSLKESARSLCTILDPKVLLTPIATRYPELIEYLETRYWGL